MNSPASKPVEIVKVPRDAVLKTRSQTRKQIGGLAGVGAQGTVYTARCLDTNRNGIVKVFKKEFANGATVKGLEFLVDNDVCNLCPSFRAPREVIVDQGFVGYYADEAAGESLDVMMDTLSFNIIQGCMAALVLAMDFRKLHARGIFHGDIRDRNIHLEIKDDVVIPSVIDWDNFWAPGFPPPPCVGDVRYQPPEVLLTHRQGKLVVPDRHSEAYAFTALIHEFLLMRNPLTGHDATDDDAINAACRGRWLHDVTEPFDPELGGYPAAILEEGCAGLFRRTFTFNRQSRATPDDWVQAIKKALRLGRYCQFCSGPFFTDVSRLVCPYCGKRFLPYRITPIGRPSIVVDGPEVLIGRNHLGKSGLVSRNHAYFRKLGADLYVQCVGKNGAEKLEAGAWRRLENDRLVLLSPGDRLRLADAEVLVEQ